MTVDDIRDILGWCALINYALLLVWFVAFAVGRGWMHRFHGRWFSMSRESFDAIHYALMGGYKLGIFLLNLVPYIAMRIVV